MALGDIAAKLGLPVFPCDAEKKPIVAGGFKAATRDEAAILRAFNTSAAQMIGMPTGQVSGVVCVDIDIKNGARGREWLAENEDALPPTRTHKTRSGGLHLLFVAPTDVQIRNSASRVAPGVDVRGEGGYIIIPPSPGYDLADDTPPAEMPRWLVRACTEPKMPGPPPERAPSRHEDSANGSPYGLRALESECAIIAGAMPGTQEPALNDGALRMGSLVAAGVLDRAYAAQCLIGAGMQMRNGDAHRPWTRNEVIDKVDRGLQDGARRPRQVKDRPDWKTNGHAEPAYEPPPYPEDELPAKPKKAEPRDIFPTLDIDGLLNLPPPVWRVHGLLTTSANAVLYGPYASLKSFAALDLSLCLAYGQPWHGRDVQQCAVLYIAGEGVGGLSKRIKAWLHFHGLEDQRAAFRLISASIDLRNPEVTAAIVRTALHVAEQDGMKVGLVVIDTLARAMVGADENSSQDMGLAVKGTDEIREGIDAATLTVHHTGKDTDRGPRGSSALGGAVDCQIRVERSDMAVTLTIEKQKDDEEGEPIILTAKKVGLDGGEPVEGEPTSLVLVADEPGQNRTSSRLSGRLSADQQQAIRVLHDALAEHGEPNFPGVPAGCNSIPEQWWRDRFYQRCKPGADQQAKQKAFRRAADGLVLQRLVAMNRGRVWTTS